MNRNDKENHKICIFPKILFLILNEKLVIFKCFQDD